MNARWTAIACAVALAPGISLAQERGRTDGPEGSEYGKGGYERGSGGRLSLGLDWGAAFGGGGSTIGPPLFIGATATYWNDDWVLFDVSGAYLANNGQVQFLAGPKLRAAFYPIAPSIGLKAGAIFQPGAGLRFGLSPQVGADVTLNRLTVGLFFAYDLALGGTDSTRLFMSVGYRF